MKKNKVKSRPGSVSGGNSFTVKPAFPVFVILALTLIAFLPSLTNGFITTWDDNVYVTDNLMIRHLDWASLKAFFTRPVNGTYVPLPLLTFALEYHFFGLHPLPYHVTNLLLHLGCTILVFTILRSLKCSLVIAAFGALLFGIHPMRVESVAWITERKDLLFSLFYLGSVLFYLKYLQSPQGKQKFLLLGIACFVLSLFSKIQAVTLPLALFLIDYLLERPFKAGLILEKIPYLALSLVFGIGGVLVIGKQGGFSSMHPADLFNGLFIGSYALDVYLLKFFAPVYLSALYPLTLFSGQALPVLFYLSPLPLIVAAFFIYRSARRTRAVVFGSLFFLFNVLFLLQVVRVGSAFAADRFTYIPYFGLIFIVTWFIKTAVERNRDSQYTLVTVLSLVSVAFIVLSYTRCQVWKNEETLWTDVIDKYPDEKSLPYTNRAVFYNSAGMWDKSIADCSRAVAINPDDFIAYSTRGVAFSNLGQWDRALSDYGRAIAIKPDFASAWSNRGAVYLSMGQNDNAISDLAKAITINPDDGVAYINRGVAFGNRGEWDKALADYEQAIRISPNSDKVYVDRGAAWVNLKKYEKAVDDYTEALRINPRSMKAYFNRGVAFDSLGRYDRAVEDYTAAIGINPGLNMAYARREASLRKLQEQK